MGQCRRKHQLLLGVHCVADQYVFPIDCNVRRFFFIAIIVLYISVCLMRGHKRHRAHEIGANTNHGWKHIHKYTEMALRATYFPLFFLVFFQFTKSNEREKKKHQNQREGRKKNERKISDFRWCNNIGQHNIYFTRLNNNNNRQLNGAQVFLLMNRFNSIFLITIESIRSQANSMIFCPLFI